MKPGELIIIDGEVYKVEWILHNKVTRVILIRVDKVPGDKKTKELVEKMGKDMVIYSPKDKKTRLQLVNKREAVA